MLRGDAHNHMLLYVTCSGEKAGAKLSQKQAGLLGCLVPPLELIMTAGCYQPLCQSAPTVVHWWCLLLEPLGEP